MLLIALHSVPMAAANLLARQALIPYLVTGVSAFLASVVFALALTAVVRKLAPRFHLIDQPDNHRKLHGRPIPLGGGVAVYISTILVIFAMALITNPWLHYLRSVWWTLVVIAVAGGIIVLVGLLDDRFALRGRVKLLGQCLAATVVIAGGLDIHTVSLFGFSVDLGLLSIPFTLLWLLGAINSVNLLDGIDGLATILGLIMVATICLMSLLLGRTLESLIALVFAGSLLGFLRFNFPPASIFLGDAGSMLIGLVVGILAISACLKGPGTVLLAASLAVWTVPILDSLAAIVRRKLTGRSIYTTDRGHIHHRLLDLLGNNRRVLAVIAAFCLLTSAGTLLSMFLQNDLIAVLACSSVVVILVASGIFGRAEFTLLTNRLRKFGQSLFDSNDVQLTRVKYSEIRLQGTKPWESLFEVIIASAEEYGLIEIRLDVNAPRSREGYHVHWEYPMDDLRPRPWRLEFPLVVGQQSIGQLLLVGRPENPPLSQNFQRLQVLLQQCEMTLQSIVGEETLLIEGEDDLVHSRQPVASTVPDLARKCPK